MTLEFEVKRFEDWRPIARRLLAQQVPPDEVRWRDAARDQRELDFSAEQSIEPASESPTESENNNRGVPAFRVPRAFMELAEMAACHRDERRWSLLYRVLWRLAHGERHVLELSTDDDVYPLLAMQKAVKRDAHKMKAFVRFRRCEEEGQERFVAWHRPDYHVVRLTAPFFARRFSVMRWAILTPDESAYWDGNSLEYGPGLPRDAAPAYDELEELWRTYYANIFNPARIKLAAMRREMPVRHWPTLPEAQMIDELVRDAPRRVEQMILHNEGLAVTAADFLPARRSLPALRKAAEVCRGCDLYKNATQTVFGAGPSKARLIMIGEQPGDQEDKAGEPFVGPAGQMLDKALVEAQIDRGDVYVTNAVKHFKWTPRGTRRLHAKPNAREMTACRPWLEAEIDVLKPEMIVCLGATAAQSLLGASFRITKERGKVQKSTLAPWIMATYHPSAILRAPDAEAREEMYQFLVTDLKLAAKKLKAG